jgi:hypothetical protein
MRRSVHDAINNEALALAVIRLLFKHIWPHALFDDAALIVSLRSRPFLYCTVRRSVSPSTDCGKQ